MIRALILDLDNTIYPVSAIAHELFPPFMDLLDLYKDNFTTDQLIAIKDDMTKKPFQNVAILHGFNDELNSAGLQLLTNLSYDKPMQTFDDYLHIKNIKVDKYLVTSGFTKLQWSKIKALGIEADFKEIYVVDGMLDTKTKKDVFAEILTKYGYNADEVLVIGDDPESEIKAGIALGMKTFLYDPDEKHTGHNATYKGSSLKDVAMLI